MINIKQFITDKQGICIMYLFVLGSTFILGTDKSAGIDSWISVGIALFLSFPIIMLYAKLISLFPDKSLFGINEFVFGKIIGSIINLLYIWYALHLAALIIRNLGVFLVVVSFSKTPLIVIMGLLSLLCLFGVKSGIQVLGRFSISGTIIVTFVAFSSMLFAAPSMDFNNVRPFLYNGIMPILKSTFSVITFPFGELIIITLVCPIFKNPKNSTKILTWSLFLSGIFLFFMTFSETCFMGKQYIDALFPSHDASRRISLADFIQRIEVLVTMNILITIFIKCCLCLIGLVNGIVTLFKMKSTNFIITPCTLLILNLSYFLYPSANAMFNWTFAVSSYYAFFFQVILPVVIGIGVFIKLKIQKVSRA
ncbi:endospore germination permease [Clostridiaceae bacterium M8S5]|nr:endospore germination permease [Clostridiaceae bacterium M8S5]